MSPEPDLSPIAAGGAASGWSASRLVPLIAIVLAAALVFAMGWHRALSLEMLARHHEEIRDFVLRHGLAALAAYVALYIVVVALSVPGAVYLTLAGGMLFGTFVGGASAVVGATIGAICLFLIARSALGEHLLRRAGQRAQRLADGFCADAFSYLLFLRLVPAFPFWLVNLVPAVAGVRLPIFAAATAIGIVPATFVFAFVGASLENVIAGDLSAYQDCLAAGRHDCRLDFDPTGGATLELLGALALLGLVALFPVLVRRVRARSRAARPSG